MSAAEMIRDARLDAGLSQAKLARRAGIPRSVLNAYERGHRQPGANALASILAAAGFRLEARPMIDLERNAKILAQVIELTESLPRKRRGALRFPPFRQRVG
ncbi:MAG: helix-turn-helix transcriptional regulator [Actinomycetota bacterium]